MPSCCYGANPAPALFQVRFAVKNPTKSGSGHICKTQIWYSSD